MSAAHARCGDDAGAYAARRAARRRARATFERHLADLRALPRRGRRRCGRSSTRCRSPRRRSSPPTELKGRIMAIVESEAELLQRRRREADRPPERSAERALALAGSAPAPAAPPRRSRSCSSSASAPASLLDGDDGGCDADDRGRAGRRHGRDAPRSHDGDDRGELAVAAACPRPPSGRVYQVWLKRDGAGARADRRAVHVRSDGEATVRDRRAASTTSTRCWSPPSRSGGSTVPTTHADHRRPSSR